MLQRFISVSRTGEFSINGDLRVLYTTMVMIRALIVCNAKLPLMMTLTIALRYSAVRRQFRNISGQKEET